MTRPLPTQGPLVFTVSQITQGIRGVLHERFDDVWVRGEIGNFKRHQPSGHLYFNLKDEGALLSCAMWRLSATGLRFAPADGIEVEARGSIDVYPRQGKYQLLVREMVPGGRGALLLALEQLRRRLSAEGLFDPARKRALPRFPRRIGLITSPSGAAVRDLLHVLGRRWPLAEVALVPVPVQGPGAAEAIAAAVRRMSEWGWAEVVIVSRGGGSLEDLWTFNEEILVRAVAASKVPIVSAVGHEVDHTLCDDAADVRAPTPSAAAELATPDRLQVAAHVARARGRAASGMARQLDHCRRRLFQVRKSYGFRRPQDLLGNWSQELDRLQARLVRGQRVELARRREGWRTVVRHLQALSPRAVLGRGYSLARLPDGRLVRSWRETPAGTPLALEYAEGTARAQVESAHPPLTGDRGEPALSLPKEGSNGA